MDIFILVLLIIGAVLFGIRAFWGQAPARPDFLAGGLLCWIVAVILERLG